MSPKEMNWFRLMAKARRTAKERGERVRVIGVGISRPQGHYQWDYVIDCPSYCGCRGEDINA